MDLRHAPQKKGGSAKSVFCGWNNTSMVLKEWLSVRQAASHLTGALVTVDFGVWPKPLFRNSWHTLLPVHVYVFHGSCLVCDECFFFSFVSVLEM